MFEFSLQLPVILIMLVAAIWTFGIAVIQPQRLRQKTQESVAAVFIESLIVGVVYGAFHFIVELQQIVDALLNGSLASLVWAGTALYSRWRYGRILQQSDVKHPLPLPGADG